MTKVSYFIHRSLLLSVLAGSGIHGLPGIPPSMDMPEIILDSILNRTVSTGPHDDLLSHIFVPPCNVKDASNVFESTSTLMVTSAATRARNRTKYRVDNMWKMFDALFATKQAEQAAVFIPKYTYLVDPLNRLESGNFFIQNTQLPNWSLLYGTSNASLLPNCPGESRNGECWVGSGRLAAMPFHASFLKIFVAQMEDHLVSEKYQQQKVVEVWDNIFQYHLFLHEVVMRGCDLDDSHTSKSMCYNVIHPWETMVDQNSPLWNVVMSDTFERMKEQNWSIPFEIPPHVRRSFDFNETLMSANIYLLECIRNQTSGNFYPYEFQSTSSARSIEDQIMRTCPFAMLDVGIAAALAQADDDLLDVGRWLSSRLELGRAFNTKLSKVNNWRERSFRILQSLWDDQEESYLSKHSLVYTRIENVDQKQMIPTRIGVANNLLSFWKSVGRDDDDDTTRERLRKMALQLLRHEGDYSFDCGARAVQSVSCLWSDSSLPLIDPALNFFLGIGLKRNQDVVASFGDHFMRSTVSLICDGHASQEEEAHQCAENGTLFQIAYRAHPNYDFLLGKCESSWTETATVVFHLLTPDLALGSLTALPPIRNSWVITLISLELVLAFAVGLSCVFLSLSLVRKEQANSSRRLGLDEQHLSLISPDDDEDENQFSDAQSALATGTLGLDQE